MQLYDQQIAAEHLFQVAYSDARQQPEPIVDESRHEREHCLNNMQQDDAEQ
jgi:hypothetical protein